jgi:hypothetical protein
MQNGWQKNSAERHTDNTDIGLWYLLSGNWWGNKNLKSIICLQREKQNKTV